MRSMDRGTILSAYCRAVAVALEARTRRLRRVAFASALARRGKLCNGVRSGRA